MGVKLEPIVKTFYEKLEEGKITARKCRVCGAVEFPPVMGCNTCGSCETEWIEISGKAKVLSIIMPSILSMNPELEDHMPYCLSIIEIEEGAQLNAITKGVSKDNFAELEAKLPLAARAEIIQKEGYKTVLFTLEE